MKNKIIKILLSLIIVIFIMTFASCGNNNSSTEGTNNRKSVELGTSMFVRVEDSPFFDIVYHKETKVMYSVSDGSYNRGTFTLLVNNDGSPMIYSE